MGKHWRAGLLLLLTAVLGCLLVAMLARSRRVDAAVFQLIHLGMAEVDVHSAIGRTPDHDSRTASQPFLSPYGPYVAERECPGSRSLFGTTGARRDKPYDQVWASSGAR